MWIAKNEKGWNAIILAAYNFNVDLVEFLVDKGADVNSVNYKGTSVLMYAKSATVNAGDVDMSLLEAVISLGADIEHVDDEGKTVLDYARENQELGVLRFLKEKRDAETCNLPHSSASVLKQKGTVIMETDESTEAAPHLSSEELRILGVLSEKGLATPQNYPLSLAAVVTGCNQASNREPVVDYDEGTVREALSALKKRGLVAEQTGAGSRVAKFRTQLARTYRLTAAQEALVAGLMLRGPQTTGELRNRWKRMHAFESLEDVSAGLDALMEWEPPLVVSLAQVPGERGERFAHSFAPVEMDSTVTAAPDAPSSLSGTLREQIDAQDERITKLEADLSDLRAAFDTFRTQFD